MWEKVKPTTAERIWMIGRTFFQFLPEVRNLARYPTDPINPLGTNTVLLDRFTAFDHERRNLDIVSGHLFRKVNSEGRSAIVLDGTRTICCRSRQWVYLVIEGR